LAWKGGEGGVVVIIRLRHLRHLYLHLNPVQQQFRFSSSATLTRTEKRRYFKRKRIKNHQRNFIWIGRIVFF